MGRVPRRRRAGPTRPRPHPRRRGGHITGAPDKGASDRTIYSGADRHRRPGLLLPSGIGRLDHAHRRLRPGLPGRSEVRAPDGHHACSLGRVPRLRPVGSQGGLRVGGTRELAREGPEEVVLKRGSAGSLALIDGKALEHQAFTVAQVDPVGAGDAFAAGYLAGHLWNLPAEDRLRVANAMGALSVTTLGDYEGLPDEEELRAFIEGEESLGR